LHAEHAAWPNAYDAIFPPVGSLFESKFSVRSAATP
jgi:hypothetical protein